MRKFVFSIFLCLISYTATAYQSEPDGFRGIKWGSSSKSLSKEFTMVDKGSYYKKNEKLKIGGAKLEFVGYMFYKNKFYTGAVKTKGKENKSALIAAFKSKFGKPTNDDKSGNMSWYGKKASITLNCNMFTHRCLALIQSTQISLKLSADKKKEAESGKNDF